MPNQGFTNALCIRPLKVVCVLLIYVLLVSLVSAQSPPHADELNGLWIPMDGPFYAGSFRISRFKGSPKIIRMSEQSAELEEYGQEFDPTQPFKNIRSFNVRKKIELEFDMEGRLVAWRDLDRFPLNKTTIDSIVHGPNGPVQVIREDGETLYDYTYEAGRLSEIVCKSNGFVIERISLKWNMNPLSVEGTITNAFSADSVKWRNEYLSPDTISRAITYEEEGTTVVDYYYSADSSAAVAHLPGANGPQYLYGTTIKRSSHGEELRFQYGENGELLDYDLYIDGHKISTYGPDGMIWREVEYDIFQNLKQERYVNEAHNVSDNIIAYYYTYDQRQNPLSILTVQWNQGWSSNGARLHVQTRRLEGLWSFEYVYW